MGRVKAAGLDKVHFAYAGEDKPGKPHTYRVQGPTFVIEFLNVQEDSAGNPANHIHSAWRNLAGDFGLAGRGKLDCCTLSRRQIRENLGENFSVRAGSVSDG